MVVVGIGRGKWKWSFRWEELLLMSGAEEVEDDFDWVEGLKWYFDEEGVPIAHGAVPESREFKRFEFAPLIALGADETGVAVHEFQQIEFAAHIVMDAADEIDRIEMPGMGENLLAARVRHIDLDTLKHLEIRRTIFAGDDERTSARFSLIAHHAADPDRPVKLGTKKSNALRRIRSQRQLDTERLVEEILHPVTKLTA